MAQKNVITALENLKQDIEYLKFLGNYPEQ